MKLKQIHYDILLFLIVALWGSLYIGNRVILQHMPVLVLMFSRFFVSALILLPATHLLKLKPIAREDWGRMLVVGVVGYFASNALLTLSTRLTSAAFSSLLNSINPIFIIVFAYFLLGERITPKKVLVILVAVAGAGIIIGAPGSSIRPAGVVCALFSVVLWSFNVIYMKRLTRKYHPLVVTANGMAISAACSLPASFLEMQVTGATVHIDGECVLWLFHVCVVCTAFAHLMWNFCMSRQDAGHCAAFYPVQPMVSMLLGWALLGESMTPSFLLGSVLIIASVAVNAFF